MKALFIWTVGISALLCPAGVTLAQNEVGEPFTFEIMIEHMGALIAQKTVTVGPGMDLEDIKISDGDPEDSTKIGELPGGSPIILKVVTEDDPIFRLMHMYINAPISLADIHTPGPVSLFDKTSTDPIDVTISNMVFDNAALAEPQVGGDDPPYFYTSFMRDSSGHFYESPLTHPYDFDGHEIDDIQVPATAYLDGDASQYTFNSTAGVVSSWTWGDIPSPGPGTTVHDGSSSGVTPADPGYVFELGLAVAFTVVPEPTTLTLLLGGLLLARRRRRR